MNSIEALAVKRILFGQTFLAGLQVACGVVALALLEYRLVGAGAALLATSGAICVSFADVPSPPRQKARELLLAFALANLAMSALMLARGSAWTLGATIVALSLFAPLLNAHGKNGGSLMFSLLFVIVTGVGTPPAADLRQALHDQSIFAAGAAAYAVYALAVAACFAARNKRQALAESLFELAGVIRQQAALLRSATGAEAERCTAALTAQRVQLTERQQVARDFVFRQVRTPADTAAASRLLLAIEIDDLMLAAQASARALPRRTAADEELRSLLADLLRRIAHELDQVAYAELRPARAAAEPAGWVTERLAVEGELARLRRAAGKRPDRADEAAALQTLGTLWDRLRECIDALQALRSGSACETPARTGPRIGPGSDLRPFMTTVQLGPRVLLPHLSPDSPWLRYAVRMALGMGCGFVAAVCLPYSQHGSWILLTVASVTRANWSMTHQRWGDRIVGNLAGCLFVALLLYLKAPTLLLLAVVFAALVAAHTFNTIVYRHATVAFCVLGLLQIHFLDHAEAFVIVERIADTVLGATIALATSYVLPNWEHRAAPKLMRSLVEAASGCLRCAADGTAADRDWRLARKRLIDLAAALSGALSRMLKEPRDQRRATAEMARLIECSHRFAAEASALRIETLARQPTAQRQLAALQAEAGELQRLADLAAQAWQRRR